MPGSASGAGSGTVVGATRNVKLVDGPRPRVVYTGTASRLMDIGDMNTNAERLARAAKNTAGCRSRKFVDTDACHQSTSDATPPHAELIYQQAYLQPPVI